MIGLWEIGQLDRLSSFSDLSFSSSIPVSGAYPHHSYHPYHLHYHRYRYLLERRRAELIVIVLG